MSARDELEGARTVTKPTSAQSWEERTPDARHSEPRSRPRKLLLGDLVLVALLPLCARLVIGAVVEPGFLGNLASVPPAIADAHMDVLRGVLAFGLPMPLIVLALARSWWPRACPWLWPHLAAAWVVLAFAETVLASPEVAIVVLGAGVIPAVAIGSSQIYFRRALGLPWQAPPWTRRRRILITIVILAVAVYVVVYMFLALAAMAGWLPPGLHEAFPRVLL